MPGANKTDSRRRFVLATAMVALGLNASRSCKVAAQAHGLTVRFVYLISADRNARSDYHNAIEQAALSVRGWYAEQLGGRTFQLRSPVVEVLKSDQLASWFALNENGENRDDWGFNNALSETSRLAGARIADSRQVWVVYSDGPGNKGRAAPSFAFLPEDDLLGLVGAHPKQPNKSRWIGGLAHELGHALGLPHPSDVVRHHNSIMWMGFYQYPDGAYFSPKEKTLLLSNQFIH